jgi:hypothetical protein
MSAAPTLPPRSAGVSELLDAASRIWRATLPKCLPLSMIAILSAYLPALYLNVSGQPIPKWPELPVDPLYWVCYAVAMLAYLCRRQCDRRGLRHCLLRRGPAVRHRAGHRALFGGQQLGTASSRLMRWIGDAPLREVVGADALGAIAAADLQLARARLRRGCFSCSAASSRACSSAMARERFLCCERSSWHSTTTPVGRCVMRIAESVLLTCWPPAPEARKVSMRSSAGLISTVRRSRRAPAGSPRCRPRCGCGPAPRWPARAARGACRIRTSGASRRHGPRRGRSPPCSRRARRALAQRLDLPAAASA